MRCLESDDEEVYLGIMEKLPTEVSTVGKTDGAAAKNKITLTPSISNKIKKTFTATEESPEETRRRACAMWVTKTPCCPTPGCGGKIKASRYFSDSGALGINPLGYRADAMVWTENFQTEERRSFKIKGDKGGSSSNASTSSGPGAATPSAAFIYDEDKGRVAGLLSDETGVGFTSSVEFAVARTEMTTTAMHVRRFDSVFSNARIDGLGKLVWDASVKVDKEAGVSNPLPVPSWARLLGSGNVGYARSLDPTDPEIVVNTIMDEVFQNAKPGAKVWRKKDFRDSEVWVRKILSSMTNPFADKDKREQEACLMHQLVAFADVAFCKIHQTFDTLKRAEKVYERAGV